MLKKLAFLLLLAAPVLKAQTAVLPVYDCTQHGTQALLSGIKSTNYQQGIIPSCQVVIYLTGTTTIATTSPQSPFTANADGSIPPIYAAINQGYDVVLSGGIPPNTYSLPITLTGLYPGFNVNGNPITPSSINTTDYYVPVGANPVTYISNACSYIASSGNSVRLNFPGSSFSFASTASLPNSCPGLTIHGTRGALASSCSNPDTCMSAVGGTIFNCEGSQCLTAPGNGTSGLMNLEIDNVTFTNFGATGWFQGGSPTTVGTAWLTLRDVFAIGQSTVNASSLGLVLYNQQHTQAYGLRQSNENTCISLIDAGSTGTIGGNSEFYGSYCYSYFKSAANGNSALCSYYTNENLNSFYRPQANTYGGDGTGCGMKIDVGANGTKIDSADFEGDWLYGFDVASVNNSIEIVESLPPGDNPYTAYVETGSTGNHFVSTSSYGSALIGSGNALTSTFDGNWQFTAPLAMIGINTPGTGWAVNDECAVDLGFGGVGKVTAESGGVPSAISLASAGNGYRVSSNLACTAILPSTGSGLSVSSTIISTQAGEGAQLNPGGGINYFANVMSAQVFTAPAGTDTQFWEALGRNILFGLPADTCRLEWTPSFGLYPTCNAGVDLGEPSNVWGTGYFVNMSLSGGVAKSSGGSDSDCWNTNGGTTVCGSGGGAFTSFIAGTNVTLTGSGCSGGTCTSGDVTVTASATAATAFSALTSSTNTSAAMLVGSGASLDFTGTGTIDANLANGAVLPSSAGFTATNSSRQLVAAAYTPANCTAGTTGSDCLQLTSGLVPVGNIPTAIPIANIGSAGLSGTAPVSIASTGAISMHVADASDNGYLSSTDWSTFNGKQAALSLIKGTYVDGDLCAYTASGTLLNCNVTPGGTGTVTDGSGTTTTPEFAESTGTAHVIQYRTASQALGDMGAQAALSLLAGTYTNGDWCSYASSGTLLNCNNAVPQVNLSLIKGTYVDGDYCTYTASGTVLNCNSTPSGGGTVTSFSAGNLSPLFTTSVATATSTPALTFSLSNAAQNSVLAGPISGGPGAPSYQTAPTISAANMTSFPTFNQATTGKSGGLTGCTQSAAGDICYWNGSAWLVLTGNASGTKYLQETSSGVPSWTTPSGSSGLSGMTAGQVPIAATATTVTSSEALAGAGAAIVTGPASSTNGDAVVYTGTGGQTADAGFAPAPSIGSNTGETSGWTLAANTVYRFTGSGASNATTPASISAGFIASIQNTGTAAVTVVTGGPTLHCEPSSCVVQIGASALITTDANGTDFDEIASNANGSAFGTAANSTAGTSGSDVLQLSSGLVPAANLPAANRITPCGVGIWGGGTAIASGTYHVNARCLNVYGVTYTITGVTCQADNSGSSTANVADSGSNALLTGAITMGTANTFVSGTQSATTTIASNVWTNWTFVADGTSTSIQCVMTTTR